MSEELTIRLRQSENACILDLAGDVTIAAQDDLNRAYQTAIQAGARTVVINLAGCDYVTSNGLAIITALLTQARREGRRICLVGLTPHLHKLCRMMGLANYAEIYSDEQEALRSRPIAPA